MALVLGMAAASGAQSYAAGSWTAYGRDAGGSHFSPLTQINRNNVTRLKVAWVYHTGALQPQSYLNQKAAFEATPVLFHGTLYFSTPFDQVIALDARTGRERWQYDPHLDRSHGYSEVSSRGVAVWTDPAAKAGSACAARVFVGTLDARLISVDAATGKPCLSFGQSGSIDLKTGVNAHHLNHYNGDYEVTSPPVVVHGVVIIGSSISDNGAVRMESGIVRGYDARTGALRWSWDPLPPRTDSGAANAWSNLAADPARDLVFIPTGSASPDYYGGLRPGDDRDADSVVALRASTGKKVWAFQVVHHDLWDYDVPSQPTLVTVHRGGRAIPAIVVTTKIGHLFLLDRDTGKPLLPVSERPVPQTDVPGEKTSPTQPFPQYDALVPQGLTAKDAWGLTPQDLQYCRERIRQWPAKMFTPPRVGWTLQFPGNIGGVDWGGGAWDPASGLYIVATNRIAFQVRLIPRAQFARERKKGMNDRINGEFAPQAGAPYGLYRQPFFSPHGVPCNAPPWGTIEAMDLATGKIRWTSPLGDTPVGSGRMVPGAINLGGPLVTAGGLVFISATRFDDRLHVYDAATGKNLWEAPLPAGAQSTPMTYQLDRHGKQYVVICAGGHGKLGTHMGDAVIAYALAP